MNPELSIDRITELAQFYQRNCYGDLSRMHPTQKRETQQAYLAGFYEGLQVAPQLPKEGIDQAVKELRSWFDKRLKELEDGR